MTGKNTSPAIHSVNPSINFFRTPSKINVRFLKTYDLKDTTLFPAYLLENQTHRLLQDFDIQTDHLISTRRPEHIIINKKEN